MDLDSEEDAIFTSVRDMLPSTATLECYNLYLVSGILKCDRKRSAEAQVSRCSSKTHCFHINKTPSHRNTTR